MQSTGDKQQFACTNRMVDDLIISLEISRISNLLYFQRRQISTINEITKRTMQKIWIISSENFEVLMKFKGKYYTEKHNEQYF